MQVSKKECVIIDKAINHWKEKEVIDEATAEKLRHTLVTPNNDFGSFTFYAFVAAISCAILAFGAIVLDEKWIERMRRFFEFSEQLIGILFLLLSALFIFYARKRKLKHPDAYLSNESFNILCILSLGVSITYLARSFGQDFRFYGLAVFAAALVYGCVAHYLQSKLIWIAALISFIASWGVQTYAWSHTDSSYFLGMNYPLRMTVLGGVMLLMLAGLQRNKKEFLFYEISFHFSWVFFLFSALLLSISGNLNYEVWSAIRQGKLFLWAIGYTLLLCGLVYYAFRLKDEFFRDIIIVFFLLNIYTRYFEYFWDKTNKGIFFALLALSFWLIGRKAEQMRKKFME